MKTLTNYTYPSERTAEDGNILFDLVINIFASCFFSISSAITVDWFSETSHQKSVFDIQSNNIFSIFIFCFKIE